MLENSWLYVIKIQVEIARAFVFEGNNIEDAKCWNKMKDNVIFKF